MSNKPRRPKLIEAFFLVPLKLNDKTSVPPDYYESLEQTLFLEFEGFRSEGRFEGNEPRSSVKGAYRMADGTRVDDELYKYFVALKKEDIPKLRGILQQCAADLGQESIYFAITGTQVEFLQNPNMKP